MEDDNRGQKRKEPEPEKGAEEVAPPKKQPKWNLHSRQLFCTYSKCPVTKEDALLQLTAKLGEPQEYLIAEEEHKVGEHKLPACPFLSATDYVQWAEARSHYNVNKAKCLH